MTKVLTPDGTGIIVDDNNLQKEGFVLVKIDSDKYWPHWNIFYMRSEIKECSE